MTRISLSEPVPERLSGRRLDQAVARMFPDYSRSRLKAWILQGSLTLNGETCRPRDRVSGGELVLIEADLSEEIRAEAQEITFRVEYDDESLIVVNKPAGLVVHPGAGNSDRTLQNGLLFRYPELATLPRAGIVHRLDKDTTGLLLVARSLPAHNRLTRELAERRIEREYSAICNGVLTAGGKVDAPIGRHPVDRKRMAVRQSGRPSVTHFRVLERYRAHTWIRVWLESGRTHQIRVHMAHIRHSLVGDPVYGGRMRLPGGADEKITAALRAFRRQALHAARLAFVHPASGEAVEFTAELPDDFRALRDALREHTAGRSDD